MHFDKFSFGTLQIDGSTRATVHFGRPLFSGPG
jgi:hypothetical protein